MDTEDQPPIEIGTTSNFTFMKIDYPAHYKAHYQRLVPEWQAAHQVQLDYGISGMSGQDLFAQECLMYLLLTGAPSYRSTSWFKLLLDPTKTKGTKTTPSMLAQRQAAIRRCISDSKFDALRARLVADGLTNINGEPDLFCWNPADLSDWFFAEAKDEDTDDRLRAYQYRWLSIAQDVLGSERVRVYVMKSV